jgi:ferric-dicitrate binding protein FerR (iron transport regulator)
MMNEFWETPLPVDAPAGNDETKAAWSKFQENIAAEDQPAIHRPRRFRHVSVWLAGAAAIMAIAVAGLWLLTPARTPAPAQKNTVSTRNGSRSKVDMPDGTQIWLNVGSRIHYDANFGKTNRDISLIGEAFFDVARDASLPFTIHTDRLTVKVLGTAFNVKAYPGDETTEAALIKGSIEVTFPDKSNERLILKPNDKISIANKPLDQAARQTTIAKYNPSMLVSKVSYQPADSTVIETAWVSNRLIFRGKTFEGLRKDIERWFNVTIEVRDPVILERKFTGNFSNENITDALEALSLTYPFRFDYNKNQNTVTIYRK